MSLMFGSLIVSFSASVTLNTINIFPSGCIKRFLSRGCGGSLHEVNVRITYVLIVLIATMHCMIYYCVNISII
jgi:hypothetical protein